MCHKISVYSLWHSLICLTMVELFLSVVCARSEIKDIFCFLLHGFPSSDLIVSLHSFGFGPVALPALNAGKLLNNCTSRLSESLCADRKLQCSFCNWPRSPCVLPLIHPIMHVTIQRGNTANAECFMKCPLNSWTLFSRSTPFVEECAVDRRVSKVTSNQRRHIRIIFSFEDVIFSFQTFFPGYFRLLNQLQEVETALNNRRRKRLRKEGCCSLPHRRHYIVWTMRTLVLP